MTRTQLPLIAAALAASSLILQAATVTWTGGTGGAGTDFANRENWTSGIPGLSDTAQFNALTPGQPAVSAHSVGGINFATPGGGWTLSGPGPLTLGAEGISSYGQTSGLNTVNVASLIMGSSAPATWNVFDTASTSTLSTFNLSSAIQLNPTAPLIFKLARPNSAAGTGTLNISGPITGTSAGGVKFGGAGYRRNVINITGGGNNTSTYNGPTAISQVNVSFDEIAVAGSGSSFGSSGMITLGDNSSFAIANYLGAGGATDRRWVLGGTGGGSINNNGTGPIYLNSIASAVTGTGYRRLQLGGANTGPNTFAELITDAGGGATSLVKNDVGTWILANAGNAYTGSNCLNGGTLQVRKLDLSGKPSSLGASANLAGNLVIGGNATLAYVGAGDTCDRLFQMAGAATINNNGSGELNLSGSGLIVQSGSGIRTLTLGGSYDAGANTFALSLGDNGAAAVSLTKKGPSIWDLTADNPYSGATTISGGTLLVNGSVGKGPIVVAKGAALGGHGTINGPVTVNSGGTLALGATIGTLTINNSLTMNGTNVMKLTKRGSTLTGDVIQGVSTLALGGTLKVSASGAALAAGDSFQLFKAANYVGTFAVIGLPALEGNLAWDSSELAGSGTIRVVPSSAVATVASNTTQDTSAKPAMEVVPPRTDAPEQASSGPPSTAPTTPTTPTAPTVSQAPAASDAFTLSDGAVVRGPQDKRRLALVFSCRAADEGSRVMLETLKAHQAKASFFVSSEFLRWPVNSRLLLPVLADGHLVGPQSGSWASLAQAQEACPEMEGHFKQLAGLGIERKGLRFFLPNIEQRTSAVAERARRLGLTMIAESPGTLAYANAAAEGTPAFASSRAILESILQREAQDKNGLNGYLLVFQFHSGSKRVDKFHKHFGELLDVLRDRGYTFVRVDELLNAESAK